MGKRKEGRQYHLVVKGPPGFVDYVNQLDKGILGVVPATSLEGVHKAGILRTRRAGRERNSRVGFIARQPKKSEFQNSQASRLFVTRESYGKGEISKATFLREKLDQARKDFRRSAKDDNNGKSANKIYEKGNGHRQKGKRRR